jgi:cation diffusion facilitator family transporter
MAFLAKSNAARLSVVSNLGLTVVKLGIGLQIHSVAVLSEAIHSGIDLLAALIAWYAVRVADIPPDKGHPYGHGKVESISGTVEALLIFLAGAWVIYEAVAGILNGRRSESVHLGLVVMAISAVVNIFVSRHLHKVAREHRSVALEADAHHLQVDVYTSIGVFIGLGLVALTGWHGFDQIVAIAVGLLILHTSFSITKAAFAPLLDATLPAEDVQLIEETLCSDPRVRGFHHLRTRKAGSVRFVDFHLLLEDDMTLKESHRISHEVKDRILAVLPGAVVEIHVEPYEEELSKKGQAIILPHMEDDVLGDERGL